MNIIYDKNKITLENPADFSLKHTFDCGQCFRFNQMENGDFIGIAFGKPVRFQQLENSITIHNLSKEEFSKNWISFLDLETDYSIIKKSLMIDNILKKAIEYGNGIRILKQDFFECVISFIFSQQNNIPKIKKATEQFAKEFGEKISYNGQDFYRFPSVSQVKDITLSDLAFLKIGYRDKYVIDAIEKINSGEISYEKLIKMDYINSKKELLKIYGVGNKVADCILLFSLGKFDAFPVDTWIKKAMQELYGLEEKCIDQFSSDNFGKYSGFAQQYIFYYAKYGKNIS